jgi:hypothetical protein
MSDKNEQVAGYREAPEQQKVGGVDADASEQETSSQQEQQQTEDEQGTAPYDPEDDKGTPDYGSNSPENNEGQ